jgi:hypothetical protein
MATNFADIFRESVASVPMKGGEMLVGHVVGQRRPRSSSSQFSVVDFGLKSEAPFAAREVQGSSAVGDTVTRSLVALEDDFNEPSFDHERQSEMPAILAGRYRALTSATSDTPQFLHGRLAGFKRGGASAKILGFDAFLPRHHVLAIKSPAVGSYSPFYLLSMATSRRTGGGSAQPALDVNPVVSSYGGILFSLTNLVGLDDAWKASGGGSAKERLAYLRLLTRVLHHKNPDMRKVLPRSDSSSDWRSQRAIAQQRHHGAGGGGGSRYRQKRTGMNVSFPDESMREMADDTLRWLDRPEFPRVWQDGSDHHVNIERAEKDGAGYAHRQRSAAVVDGQRESSSPVGGSGGGGPGGPGRWRERGGVGERRRDGDGDGSRFQTRRTAPQHSRLSRDESAHSLRDVLLSKDGSAISRERVDSSDEVAKKKKPAPPRRPNE